MATWCECECDPETAIIDLALTPRDYANPDAEWDDEQDWLTSQILGNDAAELRHAADASRV